MVDTTIVHGACPHDCPDTCAWLTTVQGSRAIGIAGDPTHPHTRGFICAKVREYLSLVYHPDRILHPLRRVGPKGAGQFERITWQDALEIITGRWREIIRESGAECILPYSYSGTLGLVHNESLDRRFFNRLGASELDRTICSAAGSAGVRHTIGARLGADPEAIPQARVILVWGANPATTHPHYIPFIQEARRRGATVVLIDPRRTLSASHADWHLAPFPGTDTALALGMMHIIVRDGLVDLAYVAQHTIGFEQLKHRVAEYPPERVASITRLPAEDITRLARLYATSKPSLIRLGYGPQRHANGGMLHRTVACLPALLGQYGIAGGGLLFSTSDWARFDSAMLHRPDLRLRPARSINMVKLGEALLSADPPIRSLFVYNSNPAASTPHQSKVLAGLRREDLFVIAHEILPTDTTDYADIVLPATTQLERWDLHKPYGSLYLALNQPAIAPLGESKHNTEVFRLLAQAMGFTEAGLFDSDEDIMRTALASPDPALSGITLESLQQTGWARLNLPRPAIPFADGRFPTPSGRVEFYSQSMASLGLDPLPGYEPEPGSPAGQPVQPHAYPLYLITPGAHHFLNSTFAHLPKLMAAEVTPTLVMNAVDASSRGISDGDRVIAANVQGECLFTAHVSDTVQPGVVSVTGTWWNKHSPGNHNVNILVGDGLTDMGGGPLFYNTMIEVRRAG